MGFFRYSYIFVSQLTVSLFVMISEAAHYGLGIPHENYGRQDS